MIHLQVNGYITSLDVNPEKFITQSVYDAATITYPVEKNIYKTTTEKKQDKVVDADGKEHILRTYEVEVPVMEKKIVTEKVSKINPDTNEEIFEEIEKEAEVPVISEVAREMVKYNPYDSQGVVIIPDDAVILTEEEYKKEIEKMKPGYVDEAKLALEYSYIVNITTDNGNKKATVVKPDGVIQLDIDRGDKGFNNLEESEKYALEFNTK